MKASNMTITYDSNGKAILTISLADRIKTDRLNKLAASGRDLEVNIDIYREKRSTNANKYYHVLKRKIADALGSSEDEIGFILLQRYGRSIHQTCPKKDAENALRENKYSKLEEIVEVNGKEVAHIILYRSSASYNSKEMSILIEGTVSECKELDIETKTPEEIKQLLEMVGK